MDYLLEMIREDKTKGGRIWAAQEAIQKPRAVGHSVTKAETGGKQTELPCCRDSPGDSRMHQSW